MMIKVLSQFLWGKWLIPKKESKKPKESGYGIIGASSGIFAEVFHPSEVLIGRPYLEVYDIDSYTLTKAEDNENLLLSRFYYSKNDEHWTEWKGGEEDANRHFLMEHYVVIPKTDFVRLRFDLMQIVSSPQKPNLRKIYHTNHQELESISITPSTNDLILGCLRDSLKLISENTQNSLLLIEILNSYQKTQSLAVTNSMFINKEQKLLLLQNILNLLPDYEALEFSFCTASYVKANPSLFRVMFPEPDVLVSADAQLSASSLKENNKKSADGFGSLLLQILDDLGVEETVRLMLLSTHQLEYPPKHNSSRGLRALHLEVLEKKRLDDGLQGKSGWRIEDLFNFIKNNRLSGVSNYRPLIVQLYRDNVDGFLSLLKAYPGELARSGFRENIFDLLESLSLHDLKLIFSKGQLAGTLTDKELLTLNDWLGKKFSGDFYNILDSLIEAGVITNSEKDDLIKVMLKKKFNSAVFMSELSNAYQNNKLLRVGDYIEKNDISKHFIVRAYLYLLKDEEIPNEEFLEEFSYFKENLEQFHLLVLIAMTFDKYAFLSQQLLEMLNRYYWIKRSDEWQKILKLIANKSNSERFLNLWSLTFLTDTKTPETKQMPNVDLKSIIVSLCQCANYINRDQTVLDRFFMAFRELGTKNKNKEIKTWLSIVLAQYPLYEIGEYLLESYLMLINKEDEIFNSLDLIRFFKDKSSLNRVAKMYLEVFSSKRFETDIDVKVRRLLFISARLVGDYNVESSIYSCLAECLERLPDKNKNLIQFHNSILAQLKSNERKVYLSGVQPSIRARLDANEYLDSLQSINMNQVGVVVDILKKLFESQTDPVEFLPVLARVNNLTMNYHPSIREEIIKEISKINLPNLPFYLYNIRLVDLGSNSSSRNNKLIDELFTASIVAQPTEIAAKIIASLLFQEVRNIKIFTDSLEKTAPSGKKKASDLRNLYKYIEKISGKYR